MFSQRASNHLMGQGCTGCKGGVRSKPDEFIEKAKALWGNRYDLSRVKYKNAHIKVGDYTLTVSNGYYVKCLKRGNRKLKIL